MMRMFFLSLAACILAGAASATTLIYVGAPYDDRWSSSDKVQIERLTRLMMIVELDFELEPNSYYSDALNINDTNSTIYVKGIIDPDPYIDAYSGFPKLVENFQVFKFSSFFASWFTFGTDSDNNIHEWVAYFYNFRGLVEGAGFSSSSTGGDSTYIGYSDYSDCVPDGSNDCISAVGARTSTPGQWTVIPSVAAVPLPASWFGLLAALGALATLRRRA